MMSSRPIEHDTSMRNKLAALRNSSLHLAASCGHIFICKVEGVLTKQDWIDKLRFSPFSRSNYTSSSD